MKTIYKFAATLLLLATLTACAPSDADISGEPSAAVDPTTSPDLTTTVEPTATPEPNATPEPDSPLYLTDVGGADMSYDEYFSVPRYVERWHYHYASAYEAYEDMYELTSATEEILARYDIISGIHGNAIVIFFMDSNHDIYRLHVPSGTLDFMCGAAFDFEAGHDGYREFVKNKSYMQRADDLDRDGWEGDELIAERERLEGLTKEEWLAERTEKYGVQWDSIEDTELSDSGYFEVLSNNDVRFTVMASDWVPYGGEDMPDYHPPYDLWDTGWCSNIQYATGWSFYGDYVTYSAALGKFGATDRALDLLGIPEEQRMTFDEFVDYYGGTPPHSGI